MRLFSFLLVVLISVVDLVPGQQPSLNWLRQFGTQVNIDFGTGIAVDANEQIHVTGKAENRFPNEPEGVCMPMSPYTPKDLCNDYRLVNHFLALFDSNGAQLGASPFVLSTCPNPNDPLKVSCSNDIAVDEFSTSYMAGSCELGGLITNPSEAFLRRVDAACNSSTTVLDPDSVVTGDSEEGYAIALDSMNNVLITGVSSSPEGGGAAFLAKLSPSGSLISLVKFGAGTTGLGVTVNRDDEIYVTGSTFGDLVPGTMNASNGIDLFVRKYHSDAMTEIWTVQFGDPNVNAAEFGSSVATDSKGSVYVAGGCVVAGSPNALLLEFAESDGAGPVWVKKIGAGGEPELQNAVEACLFDVATDSFGGIYVVGTFIGEIEPGDNGGGLFFAKYLDEGSTAEFLWAEAPTANEISAQTGITSVGTCGDPASIALGNLQDKHIVNSRDIYITASTLRDQVFNAHDALVGSYRHNDEPVILGDVNCDGIVSLLDISPLIEKVSSNEYGYKADCNCDGVVDLLDISCFIDLL